MPSTNLGGIQRPFPVTLSPIPSEVNIYGVDFVRHSPSLLPPSTHPSITHSLTHSLSPPHVLSFPISLTLLSAPPPAPPDSARAQMHAFGLSDWQAKRVRESKLLSSQPASSWTGRAMALGGWAGYKTGYRPDQEGASLTEFH